MSMKYVRGSVWRGVDDVKKKDYPEGVQDIDRPLLIISNDAGNRNNKSVVCVCITSQFEKGCYPINYEFVHENGIPNIVLCNQIHTVSKNNLKHYMFSMTPEEMEGVDKALQLALNIQPENIVMKQLESTIDNIIEKKKAILTQEQSISESKALEIASILESLFIDLSNTYQSKQSSNLKSVAPIMNAYVNASPSGPKTTDNQESPDQNGSKDTSIWDMMSTDEKKLIRDFDKSLKGTKPKVSKQPTSNSPIKHQKSPKGFWTIDRMRGLLKDIDWMPTDEILIKYNIPSVKVLGQYKWKFKKHLTSNGIDIIT